MEGGFVEKVGGFVVGTWVGCFVFVVGTFVVLDVFFFFFSFSFSVGALVGSFVVITGTAFADFPDFISSLLLLFAL